MAKKPNWTYDETVLALDLYFRSGERQLDKTDPAVIELSRLLRSSTLHPGVADAYPEFRNQNGVSMKVANLVSTITGEKGFANGAKGLQAKVWDDFRDNVPGLHQVANKIKSVIRNSSIQTIVNNQIKNEESESYKEGGALYMLHLKRERSAAAVRDKKDAVFQETGKLDCEVCGFDFYAVYGSLGTGFIECHHRIPLHLMKSSGATKLEDLALLCANCHRMIHRKMSSMSVDELKQIINNRPKNNG